MIRTNARICILLAVLALAVLGAGCDGKPTRGFYEKEGGFSFDPPKGWRVVPFPGLKYKIAHGPTEHEFAANINVVDEPYDGTLAAYVDLNVENIKKAFPDIKVLRREEFQTEDGQTATRLIAENKQQGRLLRQTFCLFGHSNRKYVATCTALAEGGESLDGLFAQSMGTFRVH